MKTYKHIFEELLKEENITQCFHDAAKRKTTRPEVVRVLKEEREVGNDRPEPQCLQEHVKALQKMLEEETYQPPEHKKMLINEYSCGKVREIIKPEFQYEQVVHHCIIKQLQPIVLHGLYEHALGSIPNRGCHSGKKQVEKWIKAYKGKKFYILKADVRHCFDTEDIRVIETKLKREIVIDSIITIHYFEYMRDFVFRGESHDFWEFMYVDKGSVIVQGGEHQFTLHAGDIIFHEPNEFHAIRSVGNSSPNLVAVSFVSHSPAMGEFRGKKMTLNMEERTLISHILDTARKVLSTPMNIPSVEQVKLRADAPIGSQQMILLYLELFLVTVLQNNAKPDVFPRRRITGTFVSPVELSGTREKRLQEITEFMEFHICEQLSLDQLCEHFSLSRSSIQKLFQKEKGCGPMEYFNGLKIQRAKDMIRDGRKNLTEIAGFLSYSSLPYFSKQFKKATGMAPMEYASSVKGITQALKGENS